MLVQCCVCEKIRQGGQWAAVPEEKLRDEEISHGYCPECAEAAFAELQRELNRRLYTTRRAASA
jgi:uncharacterized protein YlaI